MIELVVLGQPYWGTRIARALSLPEAGIRARFVGQQSYPALLASSTRAERVVLVRAGFRPGSSTRRGRLFDAYWSALRRRHRDWRACQYWLGTDVLDTLSAARSATLREGAFDRARRDLHIADAPWLAAELEEVGIRPEVVHVPQRYPCPDPPPPIPSSFRVLTYLPGGRFAFYGGEVVLEAAQRIPAIGFDVVGRPGPSERPTLPNVTWHGWVENMAPLYERASVVIRIPRHDGLGATVVEGLLNGRHVIYTYELPFVRRLFPVTGDELVEALGALASDHQRGSLGPNLEGRAYARRAYDYQQLVDRLVTLFRELP